MDPTLLTWDGFEWVIGYLHPALNVALLSVSGLTATVWCGLVIVAFKKNSHPESDRIPRANADKSSRLWVWLEKKHLLRHDELRSRHLKSGKSPISPADSVPAALATSQPGRIEARQQP
jgi:hypothetical protein